jgi:TetR/AcrR family transcriptional regulator, transcriptional repressor for nem operon
MARAGRDGGTPHRILDIAERLIQVRGYNGFSYADIAATLKITKASLHYHFPTKADLAKRLMERYRENFLAALAAIDASATTAREKLDRYVAIYANVLAANRMCLCGMLAAEYATLPKQVRAEVTQFFEANDVWLASVLEQGRHDGLPLARPAIDVARLIVAALEGAMMLARCHGDAGRFQRAGQLLLDDIIGAPPVREADLAGSAIE